MSSSSSSSSTYHFPIVWIKDDTEIDPRWIEQVTNLVGVSKCTVDDISNAGRRGDDVRNGATLRLELSYDPHPTGRDEEKDNNENTLSLSSSSFSVDKRSPMSLVIKQVPPSGLAQSRMLGLAREALFYRQLAPKVVMPKEDEVRGIAATKSTTVLCGSVFPTVYHSHGDMATGEKLIVMEDLSTSSYLDSGILFGPGNPNNWTRDLPALIAQAYQTATATTATATGSGETTTTVSAAVPSSYQVANDTFLAIAKIHATFWKDESLLDEPFRFLRCSDWIQGQGKSSWEASQGYIQGIWNQLLSSGTLESVLKWDPSVLQCTTQAMAGISWDSQLQRLNSKSSSSSSNWTLVHGDFWPGNVLVSSQNSTTATTTKDLKLLDWEMVGLGSGPQDLGQYILSNMDPQERRECEHDLIRNYYRELIRHGISEDEFTWDECWREYQIGGVERWLWFLVYFIGQGEGPLLKWGQFFHDQIQAFVHDHQIQPSDLVQPRP